MNDYKINLYWKIVLNLIDTTRFLYWKIWKLFHLKLYENPEKHSSTGIYCYNHVKFLGKGRRKVKYCSFHKNLFRDLCMWNGTDCLMDSCKTCDLNYDDGVEGKNDI